MLSEQLAKERRSKAFMLEMQASFDNETENNMERKRFEWKQAVTEELRLLDERQRSLGNMLEGVEEGNNATQSPKLRATLVAIIRNEINEKYDALTQIVGKIRTENATMAAEMTKLTHCVQLHSHTKKKWSVTEY